MVSQAAIGNPIGPKEGNNDYEDDGLSDHACMMHSEDVWLWSGQGISRGGVVCQVV